LGRCQKKAKDSSHYQVNTAGLRPGSRHPFYGLIKRVQKAAQLVLAHRITLLQTGVLMWLLCSDGCRRPLGRRMVRFISCGVEGFSAVGFWRSSGARFGTSEHC